MLKRCMYANHKETGPQGQRDLPAILKELIDQFVSGPMRVKSGSDQEKGDRFI